MTTFNPTEQGFALHAISQIFRKAYGAAKTVDGAYERVQEKIRDMHRGTKTRQKNFISSEAVIKLISDSRTMTEEKAKLLYESMSTEERREIFWKINKNEKRWDQARKFDLSNNGGQKFVTESHLTSRIVFTFIDDKSETFDLTVMMEYKGFRKLYPELVAEGRKQLIKTPETENTNEIEMARVVSDRISKITLWKMILVSQAVEQISPSDKSYLYSHLQLLPASIRKVTKVSNKAHDKISFQDVLRAIQIVIEDLEESSAESAR